MNICQRMELTKQNRVESGGKWTCGPEGSFCHHLPWAFVRMLEGSSSLNGPYVSAFFHLTMVSGIVIGMNRIMDLVPDTNMEAEYNY